MITFDVQPFLRELARVRAHLAEIYAAIEAAPDVARWEDDGGAIR